MPRLQFYPTRPRIPPYRGLVAVFTDGKGRAYTHWFSSPSPSIIKNTLSALGHHTSGYDYHDADIEVFDPSNNHVLVTVGKDEPFDMTTFPLAIKGDGGDRIEDVLKLSYELATTPIDDWAEARPCRYRMDAPVSHRKGTNLNTVDSIDTSQAFYLAKDNRRGWFITSDLDIGDEERVDFADAVFTNDDVAEIDISGFVAEPLSGRIKFKWLD